MTSHSSINIFVMANLFYGENCEWFKTNDGRGSSWYKKASIKRIQILDQLLLAGVESDPGDAAADRPGLRPAQLIPRPQSYPGSTGQLSGLSLADPFALKPNLKLFLSFTLSGWVCDQLILSLDFSHIQALQVCLYSGP